MDLAVEYLIWLVLGVIGLVALCVGLLFGYFAIIEFRHSRVTLRLPTEGVFLAGLIIGAFIGIGAIVGDLVFGRILVTFLGLMRG